jgi:hypothetical protein
MRARERAEFVEVYIDAVNQKVSVLYGCQRRVRSLYLGLFLNWFTRAHEPKSYAP